MDRRDFLKVLGVASVAPAALVKTDDVGTYRIEDDMLPHLGSALFDPEKGCEDFITISDFVDFNDPDDPVLVEAMRLLDEQIMGFVPPGYRHRIHYVTSRGDRTDDPLSQTTTVGWRYTPARVMTATRVMMQERERLNDHIWDCMKYATQRRVL